MKLYAIGSWISRERSGVAHYVESIVSGDAVTRCGRRLSDEPTRDGGGLGLADHDLRKCLGCWRSDQPEA